MAQKVRCLLHKREDLNSDPQYPHKQPDIRAPTCSPRTEEWRQEDFLELAGQLALPSQKKKKIQ